MKLAVCVALVVAGLLFAAPSFAHHGTGVAYDTEKSLTLKGTVTEWIWANPHCGILFDVTDEKGNVQHWGAELGNPHTLSTAGLSKDVLKPGDKITVIGHPAKSGAPRLNFQRFITADGRTLPERRRDRDVTLADEPAQ